MSVVDASVWVSRFVPSEAHHSVSRNWILGHLRAGGMVAEPTILLPEVSGALARRTGNLVLAKATAQHLAELDDVRFFPIDRLLARMAAEIAADLGLRGADAIYVALAHRLNTRLVTWDREQQSRASRLIRVDSPATSGGAR